MVVARMPFYLHAKKKNKPESLFSRIVVTDVQYHGLQRDVKASLNVFNVSTSYTINKDRLARQLRDKLTNVSVNSW